MIAMANTKKVRTYAGPTGKFAQGLRKVRIDAGEPPYRHMAHAASRSGAPCSHTSLSEADRGDRLPTWKCTLAYLRGCGIGDKEIHGHWRKKWEDTKRAIARKAEADGRRHNKEDGGIDGAS